MSRVVEYWRHPTRNEIKRGEGAIHTITVDADKVMKPDGSLKKWFVENGLRYNLKQYLAC